MAGQRGEGGSQSPHCPMVKRSGSGVRLLLGFQPCHLPDVRPHVRGLHLLKAPVPHLKKGDSNETVPPGADSRTEATDSSQELSRVCLPQSRCLVTASYLDYLLLGGTVSKTLSLSLPSLSPNSLPLLGDQSYLKARH